MSSIFGPDDEDRSTWSPDGDRSDDRPMVPESGSYDADMGSPSSNSDTSGND